MTQKFVLLVEDEEIITQTFVRVFEGQSYAMLDTASTVREALDKILFVVYDYIFLDMKIDGDSWAGMVVLRTLNSILLKLRADGLSTTEGHVIIMSGSVSLQDLMLEANALDVFHFLNKPVNFSEGYLLRVLQKLGLPLLPRRTMS